MPLDLLVLILSLTPSCGISNVEPPPKLGALPAPNLFWKEIKLGSYLGGELGIDYTPEVADRVEKVNNLFIKKYKQGIGTQIIAQGSPELLYGILVYDGVELPKNLDSYINYIITGDESYFLKAPANQK